MWDEGVERDWRRVAEGVVLEIKEWREQHPRASFTEIESAVDGLWAKARARILQDVALASDAKNISPDGGESCSRCSECGGRLESRGEKVRKLSANHDQRIELKRSYGVCPACGTGIFPPGLGIRPVARPPYPQPGGRPGAARQLVALWPSGEECRPLPPDRGIGGYARRVTEKSGQAYVELQTEEAGLLEAEMREARAGPGLQQLSGDGAMVPLLGGEWAEVKTPAIGTIDEPDRKGEARARDLSYFSRMMDHLSFAGLATVETHRRGMERAGTVCAVVDGADWQQKFIDLHRPNAVRILDWRHGAEHLAKAGQAAFGAGTAALSEWLGTGLRQLKHGEPELVLRSLRGLCRKLDRDGAGGEDGLKTVKGSLGYLEKRRGKIRYAEFRAQGYPRQRGGGKRQQAGGGGSAQRRWDALGPGARKPHGGPAYGGLQRPVGRGVASDQPAAAGKGWGGARDQAQLEGAPSGEGGFRGKDPAGSPPAGSPNNNGTSLEKSHRLPSTAGAQSSLAPHDHRKKTPPTYAHVKTLRENLTGTPVVGGGCKGVGACVRLVA